MAAVVAAVIAATACFASPPDDGVEVRYGVVDPPVVAQRDITIRYPMSIHPLDPQDKPLEASSIAWAADRLFITSDRHSHALFTASINIGNDALTVGLPEPHQIIRSEKYLLKDVESVTTRHAPAGTWVYTLGSMSNEGTGQHSENRQHVARALFDDEQGVFTDRIVVLSGDPIRAALNEHFEQLRVTPYSSFNIDLNQNTDRWGNIEGAAWTPKPGVMLCGLRTPLAAEDALFFTLEGVDKAFDTEDNHAFQVTDLFRLNLGGRGVSDLSWDPRTQGYLITAALSNGPKLDDGSVYPLQNLLSSLFWWSGHKQDPPRLIAQFTDLNIDGVCRMGDSPYVLIVSDEGDVSEERRGRQSVLTVMYFDGLPESEQP